MAILENLNEEPEDYSICPLMSAPVVISIDPGLGLNNQGAKVNISLIPVPCIKEKCKFYYVWDSKKDSPIRNKGRSRDCLLL